MKVRVDGPLVFNNLALRLPAWACAQASFLCHALVFLMTSGPVYALPSLNALKAFEARQENFTKAAQELFATQGAGEICGMAEATSLNTP